MHKKTDYTLWRDIQLIVVLKNTLMLLWRKIFKKLLNESTNIIVSEHKALLSVMWSFEKKKKHNFYKQKLDLGVWDRINVILPIR